MVAKTVTGAETVAMQVTGAETVAMQVTVAGTVAMQVTVAFTWRLNRGDGSRDGSHASDGGVHVATKPRGR